MLPYEMSFSPLSPPVLEPLPELPLEEEEEPVEPDALELLLDDELVVELPDEEALDEVELDEVELDELELEALLLVPEDEVPDEDVKVELLLLDPLDVALLEAVLLAVVLLVGSFVPPQPASSPSPTHRCFVDIAAPGREGGQRHRPGGRLTGGAQFA